MHKFMLLLLLIIKIPAPNTSMQEQTTRRVNIPYLAEPVVWNQSAIFWFGQNEQGVPSKNYADVRIAYTAQSLHLYITIVDYYLWYKENPLDADDLTQYDAIAIYLDSSFDRATTPQTDDYSFLVGAHHWPNENATQYHRQARGDGTVWDTTWLDDWSDFEAMEWWCNPGPNSNECGIDYGWKVRFAIPWETLGQSGPPTEGTLWGLGVQLYDRDDQPPAGYVEPEHWPETFDADNPATWGELHFGYADYQLPPVIPAGTTTIRAASPEDNTVEDSWMGGGGWCSGGHEGGSEINHGDNTSLFVGSETAATHFPCYNKSYLRFSLDAIPPNKTIISASLTLHLWGYAGETPDLALPSWVHLFTISDPWDEMTIHWNNAPLAQQNVSATWVNPYSGDREHPDWPGDPYTWDAIQAVAEAHAAGQPLDVAIYSSDTDQHSSKYMTSSEAGDWNAEGRPTLTVVWGQATPLGKSAQTGPMSAGTALKPGDTITYTLHITGSGQALTVTDVLPTEVSHPLTYTASDGSIAYDSTVRRLTWTGTPTANQVVTVSYPVTVIQSGSYTIKNTAHMTTATGSTFAADATILVGARQIFLPCIMKQQMRH